MSRTSDAACRAFDMLLFQFGEVALLNTSSGQVCVDVINKMDNDPVSRSDQYKPKPHIEIRRRDYDALDINAGDIVTVGSRDYTITSKEPRNEYKAVINLRRTA